MAMDPNCESLTSLTEAAKLLPRRRRGKRPHVSCLYRWTTTGCKGVVLESLQCGGTRVTSREALARFLNALTRANPPARGQSPQRRQQAAKAADEELRRLGD